MLWLIPMTGLIWHCYRIQIKRHDELLGKARQRYTTTAVREGKYGEIFDMDKRVLVGNEPKTAIVCSPYSAVYEPYLPMENRNRKNRPRAQKLRERRRRLLAGLIAKWSGRPEKECFARLEPFLPEKDSQGRVIYVDGKARMRKNQYWVICRDMEPEKAEAFRSELLSLDQQLTAPGAGFVFRDVYVRTYPQGRLLSNVLGFSDIENDKYRPRTGLELQLSKLLAPGTGTVTYERDREGKPLVYGKQSTQSASDGHNVYLTIREPVQAILEEELDRLMAEHNPEKIYAVVVEPSTGNILAMAQRPNFNPNDRATFLNGTTGLNLASDNYEPGSVMKPFTVARALETGVVTPQSIIDCENGRWLYGGRILSDSSRRCNGKRTVTEVIGYSSNIGTAKIALMLGDAGLNRLFRDFQFGRKTGLPFAAEHRGRLPVLNSRRDKLTPTRVPIGYGLRVTVLQLARAYCAIANADGAMPTLRLIDRIEDPNTGKVEVVAPGPRHKVFSNLRAREQIRDIMVEVVSGPHGTGRRARIPGYEVAGKTGTSRKYRPEIRGYGEGKNILYYSSFAGFVPARDPRMLMVITVDNARKGTSGGGAVAAPVFQRTMERMLRFLNVPPDSAVE